MRAAVFLALMIAARSLAAQDIQQVVKAGGAVFATSTSGPEVGVGYPLAEWESLTKHGWGTIVGLLGPTNVGLGLGHRFDDYAVTPKKRVSLTVGPSFTMKYRCQAACPQGLRHGNFGAFALISLHEEK